MEQPAHRHGLIDTDILVDAARGFSDAGRFLNELAGRSKITISAISAMELIAGCQSAAQLAQVKAFLEGVTVVPLSETVSAGAQTLMETFTLSHGLLLPDALIAATSLESNLALYTRNIRHFRIVPELLVIQPY